MGLLGMQERVSLVGGEFAIESLPGGGTEVRAGFAVGEKAPIAYVQDNDVRPERLGEAQRLLAVAGLTH